MKHKERVRAVYPRASAKRYIQTGGRSYYLVWDGFTEKRCIGSGDTQSAAWKDAAARLPAPPPPEMEPST